MREKEHVLRELNPILSVTLRFSTYVAMVAQDEFLKYSPPASFFLSTKHLQHKLIVNKAPQTGVFKID